MNQRLFNNKMRKVSCRLCNNDYALPYMSLCKECWRKTNNYATKEDLIEGGYLIPTGEGYVNAKNVEEAEEIMHIVQEKRGMDSTYPHLRKVHCGNSTMKRKCIKCKIFSQTQGLYCDDCWRKILKGQ
jgi:hypothetical protein